MEDLEALKENFDVIGLSETHCTEETHRTWTDGTLFGAEIHVGARDQTANKGGVGFIIHPRLVACKRVQEVRIVSSRIAVLKLAVPGQRRPLKVIQVYAPHSGYDNDVIEQFYDEVSEQLDESTCRTVIIGDFNARLGRRKEDKHYIGTHSVEQRNESGEILATFAESHRMFVTNSFFEKPPNKRWTWRSPAFDLFCELDYVLCDNRSCITNVEVLSRFGCSSDHRPIRATIQLDGRLMEKKLLLSSLARTKKINYRALKSQASTTDWKTYGRINEQYEQLMEKLKRCMKAATVKENEQFRSRLSEDTRRKLAMLKSLKATPANAEQYRTLATEVRRQVTDDHKAYREERMTRTAEERASLKKCAREIAQTRFITAALKDNNGSRKTNRREIEEICRSFYTQLFESKIHVERNQPAIDDDANPLPPITWEEVKDAVRSMKLGKAPGPDGITAEHLRAGGQPLWSALAKLFNTCLKTRRTPEAWKESKTVLLYKKGDPEDIGNYRPICLLSVVYKVFTKLILTRLTETLDAAQPPEQAGFRSGYCTMDHLQTINQLQEKAREFGQRLFIVFIDYEKAFDSIEMNAVWNALEEQGVDPRYVSLLEETNTGCTTDITLFQDPIRIPVRRGVRQGDTISPKLFTAALESIFRSMNWETDKRAGVSINGQRLTHLRFADDIALVGRNMADVQRRLNELDARSTAMGLRINRRKTEWLEYFDTQQELKLGEETIARTWKYIYLGQELRWDHKLDGEITRRQKAAWNAYNNVKDALRNLTDAKLRANLFNTTVLPALLYGCETWAPTQSQERRIAVTQRAIERRTLGISMREERRNEEVRELSQFKDAVIEARKRKLRWAGHVARMTEDKWTMRCTSWKPKGKRPQNWGVPTRWEDAVIDAHGENWKEIAQDRQLYRHRCALHLERLGATD